MAGNEPEIKAGSPLSAKFSTRIESTTTRTTGSSKQRAAGVVWLFGWLFVCCEYTIESDSFFESDLLG